MLKKTLEKFVLLSISFLFFTMSIHAQNQTHICAAGDYTQIFMIDGKTSLIEKPLLEWEVRLPEKHFTRIHRSTIINLNQIKKIETLFNRTMEVSLKNYEKKFSVSRRFAAKLKEKFG